MGYINTSKASKASMESMHPAREMEAMTEMGEMMRETAGARTSHHTNAKKAHLIKKEVEWATKARIRPHTD